MRIKLALAIAAVALALSLAGVPLTQAQVAQITAVYVEDLPLDPEDSFWAQAEKVEVPLAAQQLVYPVTWEVEPRTLRVAAATDGSLLAVYIEWSDPEPNMPVPGGLDVTPDKVAFQLPVRADSLPYICMGTVEDPVAIVLWQAPDTVETLVAGSGYGMRPEEREALGLQSVPTRPVERLPDEAQVWSGEAVYSDGVWRVVLYGPLGSTYPLLPNIKPGSTVSIAFALWEGSRGEIGAQKSTSAWLTLAVESPAAPAQPPETPAPETVTETVERLTEVTRTILGDWSMAALGALIAALVYTIIVMVYYFSRRQPQGAAP